MSFVLGYKPKEFSDRVTDNGVVLCESKGGSFLLCRFPEDIERLKDLLNSIDIKKMKETPVAGRPLRDGYDDYKDIGLPDHNQTE